MSFTVTGGSSAGTVDTSGLVSKASYDANSILAATADDTPVALTVGASSIVGRLAAGGIVAMSTAQLKTLLNLAISDTSGLQAALDAKVAASLFDANSILAATTDDTPAALTVAASTVVGRLSSGGVVAMTMAQLKTLLALGIADTSGLQAALDAKAALTGPFAPTTTGANSAGRYVGVTATGAPSSGTFVAGDWVSTVDGRIHICTAGGTPGTWLSVGPLTSTTPELVGASAVGTSTATARADHSHSLFSIVSKTGTYTAAAGEMVLCDATSGAFTITSPGHSARRMFAVQKTDASANAITVSAAAGTINGAASITLLNRWSTALFISDNSNWRIYASVGYDMAWSVVATKTGAYSALNREFVPVDATSGSVTITSPAHGNGRIFAVKKKDSTGNAVVVSPISGLIDDAASLSLTTQQGVARLVSDGTNWQTY